MRVRHPQPDIIYRRPRPFLASSVIAPQGVPGGDGGAPDPSWLPRPDPQGPSPGPRPEGDPVPQPRPMPGPVPQRPTVFAGGPRGGSKRF